MFRFFTGNPQVANSKLAAMQAELDGLIGFVQSQGQYNHRLETRIAEMQESIEAYAAALHRLRGQVHGPKAQEVERKPARQVQLVENMSKDQLRARAGIIAGRPAPHQTHEQIDQSE